MVFLLIGHGYPSSIIGNQHDLYIFLALPELRRCAGVKGKKTQYCYLEAIRTILEKQRTWQKNSTEALCNGDAMSSVVSQQTYLIGGWLRVEILSMALEAAIMQAAPMQQPMWAISTCHPIHITVISRVFCTCCPIKQANHVTLDVVSGLQCLRARGIVHQDFKPEILCGQETIVISNTYNSVYATVLHVNQRVDELCALILHSVATCYKELALAYWQIQSRRVVSGSPLITLRDSVWKGRESSRNPT